MEHLAQEMFSENFFVEDEIDEAFAHLPQILPPPSLVNDIMAAVDRLPLSEIAVSTMPLDRLEHLHIALETGQLC